MRRDPRGAPTVPTRARQQRDGLGRFVLAEDGDVRGWFRSGDREAVAAYVAWAEETGVGGDVRKRCRVLARLSAELGKPLGQVSQTDLLSWQQRLARGAWSAQQMAAVRDYYAWAFERGLVRSNPGTVLPRERRQRPRRLDASGRALWEHVDHLQLRGLRDSHITSRRTAVQRLEEFLGHGALDATPDQLKAYVRQMPRSTPRSLYAELSHLSNYYRWCVEFEHLAVDPSRRLPRPKLPRLLPRPISEESLKTAIDNAPDRIRVWLVLAAYAGLRATEIAGLSRHDVLDNAEPPVLVAHGKGGKDRVVPMCQRVIDELHRHGLPPRGPIFLRADGRPGAVNAHRVSSLCSVYMHSVGVTDRLHTLRHRFATETYRLSQDIRVVQELLGHESPQTTAGYAAYSRQNAVAAVRMLDGQDALWRAADRPRAS